MTKVYIAGPITGRDDYEEKFFDAEARLKEIGLEPMNPIREGLVEGWNYKDYIDRGLRMLMECDAVLLLEGWENSVGAKLEERYAYICGLERFRFGGFNND